MPQGKPQNNISQSNNKISSIMKNIFAFFKLKNSKSKLQQNIEQEEFIDQEINPNIAKYEKLTAEEIMIPRVDIRAIDYHSSLEDIANTFLKNRHTRMPVYKNDLDNTIGFINIKDILPYIFNAKETPKFKIDTVLRNLLVIPPSMKILNLLEKMRQTRTHIALVVDELGGADGLITIENLIEEIIGDIEDEHDPEDNNLQFKKINNKTFEVSGRMEIEELQEKLHINLNSDEIDEEYNTLGGLILSISSYVPNKGDKVIHPTSNIIFEIVDRDPRRIKTVRIHLS